ncbi:glycosyltransferase family 2 protein [Allorhizobium taibaishanense]|uniref:Glycosyl transferase n=1 Tax=Allorhizobium taibaishanense TaxID=887144 RepID=A0A1Q9ABS4_9HYPH|nr:glycosyltransferase family 2 protein [Allorhizobium taibaishanense]MBB4010582.1 succinoglycan biosynthesis protein ExoO [Allorhizobium taibaishanense]OLP52313.1 glycosyl transferase [Allorhizobium taibaishanense]
MIAWTPDVTVVVAAYNSSETIQRAIDSALAQVNVTVEVIVADDCSSDDTRGRVAAITDPRVRLIALESNLGPGGARNAAIDAARGRWIAVLDSDDVFKPMRLFRMIERAEQEKAEIVVDNLDVIDMNGDSRTMFLEEALVHIGHIDLATFIGSNILFRSQHNYGYMKPIFLRSFLNDKDLRFDESLRIGEDYLLLASALAEGAICAVEPTAGYAYYIREGSISRVLRLHHVDAMMTADAGFMARYNLHDKALAAQTARTRSLKEAQAFIMLIDGLKARSLSSVVKVAMANPLALRHLKMPIAARFRRLAESLWKTRTAQRAIPSDRTTGS